ncbi:hypothetical protein CDL15_Pgr019127 [Punica granatum]|uniref:Transcription termination factor MTEF1, chloroplastic n=2 Tax=Punica granatum TaxID=22663 RepID=A0A218XKM1_PUNGR|nr:hypothetical protein CDL15_Pgr019127 [Punica granatum]
MRASPLHSSFCCYSSSSSSSSYPNSQLSTKPAIKPQSSSLLQEHPLYSPAHSNISLQFKEKILCLEIMGVDSGRALSLNPSLHSVSLHSIHSVVSFLQSKGIHQKDLARIFGMCPRILSSDIRSDLAPVFAFLSQDLKVPEHGFRRAVNKCPRLLVSSVPDQLKPALFYLQRLGFKDLQAMTELPCPALPLCLIINTALAYQDPVLLVSSVENTLIPKLKYLESIGFLRDETVDMVLRCPALFTFSIENNFKPKLEFFREEMQRTLEELKDFPQYFAFSLEKRIKPRHEEAMRSRARLPLPVMLKSTNEEFHELIKQGTSST